MIKLIQSDAFKHWLLDLKDRQARVRIQMRIDRMALGNPGDVKSIRGGVSEMRIDYGPGYRVYFTRRGQQLVLLLAGGDKSTQSADIERSIAIANDWKEQHHD
jgi:putative addiction module killer protein